MKKRPRSPQCKHSDQYESLRFMFSLFAVFCGALQMQLRGGREFNFKKGTGELVLKHLGATEILVALR